MIIAAYISGLILGALCAVAAMNARRVSPGGPPPGEMRDVEPTPTPPSRFERVWRPYAPTGDPMPPPMLDGVTYNVVDSTRRRYPTAPHVCNYDVTCCSPVTTD